MGYDRWNCFVPAPELFELFQRNGYPPLPALLLAARGFSSIKDVKSTLRSDRSGLHDPFALPDMRPAVERIQKALEEGETIGVYGDYDADGMSAVALMVRELRRLGAKTVWYIPDRITEGYGLNRAGLETLAAEGTSLIITVDTGTSAQNEALWARELHMDLIITDHHECKETLPDALAVINPHRPDSRYPFAGLAGVGVAFKLLCALTGDTDSLLARYGDLVALGTVADVMPVLDENRILIVHGLRVMKATQNPGLQALLRQPELSAKLIDASFISYTLAPRINAAGRLGKAETALRLLLADDLATAGEMAHTLCDLNAQRKIREQDMLELSLSETDLTAPALIPASKDFHIGIAGIVAARLALQYDRPVFLICIEGEEARGSARSVGGINVNAILSEVSEHLTLFGGHEQAAGFSLPSENISAFREAVYHCCETLALTTESTLSLDGEVLPEWLSIDNIARLEALAPFGSGFQPPIFCLRNALVQSVKPLGGGKHIRITLQKNGVTLQAVWFGHTASEDTLRNLVDAAFRPEINRFRGQEQTQLHIVDLRVSEWQREASRQFEIYRRFSAGRDITAAEAALLLPDRDDMVSVWRTLGRLEGKLPEDGEAPFPLAKRFMDSGKPETMGRVWISLDVLCEMKLCARGLLDNGRFLVWRRQGQDKIVLADSAILRALRRVLEGGDPDGDNSQ